MPVPRGKKPTTTTGTKIPKLTAATTENQGEGPQVKRSSSPPHGAPKKRTAFIDITNAAGLCLSDCRPESDSSVGTAHKVHISLPGRKKDGSKKQAKKTSSTSVPAKNQANLKKSSSVSPEGTTAEKEKPDADEEEKEEEEEAQKDVAAPVEELAAAAPPAVRQVPAHLQKQVIPKEFDIDSDNSEDCYMCPEYAKDIFDYLKQREEKFVLCNYMSKQPSLNPEMRAILIDWLVEVQENFELYHETLYLAVKMADHYLDQTPVHREMLQLVGSTAMLIASKFEERSPPCVDDFLYICDDAYKREELISMEANILQTLRFDINIPIPYRFLRRYAKCVSAGMDTLTLARYYCEMSLMEMELVSERGSLLASACLLMALVTKDLGGWSPILQFHSGYQTSDLAPVVRKLYTMLLAPPDDKLRAVRNKYSHKVFFEVATLPLISIDVLESALSQ
ncbi:G2/mitotic-specific cyclin-B3 isoform X1 [Acanthopagrus latus]|uniref:G2/mitotic-specific cyclin-B3 isoform X1 n=1 Tax=Acanthopagrus latus TaxID=8177 RepID=UPI00187CBD51|nr:G2/mitotic-specific cyclin-B3 isoform X1 [Acanthopagrus latus]XP_036966938.1 G2/mitotic-specific cyclin-B3 isoform X1 [Acanthopagrus latus]